jgi:hypothetical protein
VFTARYGVGPYIKQICFVFKGLIFKEQRALEECYVFLAVENKGGTFFRNVGYQ